MNRAFRTLIALLVLAAPFHARADEWPTLGGHPDRNGVSAEKGLPQAWDGPKKQNIKWVADLGKSTYGNPVVAGGRVFIGTNNDQPRDPAITGDRGVLMAFSAADGKFLWQAVHEKLPGGEAVDAAHIGICSTPVAQGEFVYYVSNRNELVCRKAADGAQVWLLDMRKDLGALQDQATACSPLLVDGLLFVLTGNGLDHKAGKVLNPKAPSFIAVNAATGKLVWQDASPGDRILSSQWGSAAYGVVDGKPQVAFPGGDGWVYAFEPATGKPIWKFNCKAHEKLDSDGKPELKNTLVAAPVYSGHTLILATGIDTDQQGPGCLRAIDARKTGDITKTGELWKVAGEDFGVSISTAAVHDGLVYATELSGFLSCIELSTGKRHWRHDFLTQIWGSPVIADGKVWIRTGDGDVQAFATGKEKKPLFKNETIQGLSHGTLTPSDGVLYIAGTSKLWAVGGSK